MNTLKIKLLCGWILLFSGFSALAENPCSDPGMCQEIGYQDALAMSRFFEEGIRDYEMVSSYKLRIEGDYGKESQMTYDGSGCYARSGFNDDMTSFESYQNEKHAYTKQARRSVGTIRGLRLKNQSTVNVDLVLKFREVYLLQKHSETEFSLAMTKEIINGQIPDSVSYEFAVNEVRKNCFANDTVPFKNIEVIYNESPGHLKQSISEEFGIATRKSYQLGDSVNGFFRPNNAVNSDEQVSQTEGVFNYGMRGRQSEVSGTISIRNMRAQFFGGVSGEVYEASAMTRSYEENAKLFMAANTAGSDVEFWLSPTTNEMFMVFSADSGAKPVRFKMKEEYGDFTYDGDFVKYENKTVAAFVVLTHINAMTKMMRESAFRRSYGILGDGVAEFKDALTQPDENGDMRTEVNPVVRNLAHNIYYTTHTLLKQRFLKDTKEGMRREPVVNAMLQQINHMLGDYGFDDIRSGAPLYAIYGDYVKDTITEMRVPGFIDKVPPEFSEVNGALGKVFIKAEALKIREGLSDANIKTGKIVDQLIDIYENEAKPLIQSSVESGMVWNGFDIKLDDYMESIKGIRIVDEEEDLGIELFQADGEFLPTATGPIVGESPSAEGAGEEAPRPRRRK